VAVVMPLVLLLAVRTVVGTEPEVRRSSFASLTDWYVSAEAPGRSFNDHWLQTSNSARHHVRTYLRFRVDGLTGGVTRVTLRVHAATANRGGFLVVAVPPDAWTGRATSWRDAPPLGQVVGGSGPIDHPGWVAADLDLAQTYRGPVLLALVAASTATGR
jgi:hypothetical protein